MTEFTFFTQTIAWLLHAITHNIIIHQPNPNMKCKPFYKHMCELCLPHIERITIVEK